MAVMRNSIIFGGVNSADFGIYISGEGVFNAPKRAVEYVQVPGRNGAIALDQGYYENIEVTYPGFNYEPNMEEFRRQLALFRNAICSQVGYQKLSDTFHPDEYRMAVYSDGLEIDPIKYNTASQLELVFNCKPQRYLTSGEAAVSVQNGETLFNPTPYDASPLLAVEGYGTIGLNGDKIEIENAVLGNIELLGARGLWGNLTYKFSNSQYNIGDTITINSAVINWTIGSEKLLNSVTATDSNSLFTTTTQRYPYEAIIKTSVSPITFTAGTAKKVNNQTIITLNSDELPKLYINTTVEYIPNNDSGSDTLKIRVTKATGSGGGVRDRSYGSNWGSTVAESTVSLLGDPTYIDCDLGDAYMIKDGTYISLNSYIDLGSDLPVLTSGQNEITLDDTITELKITPRWWIL